MRIYFVGIHSKPGMAPLDSRTASGKVIDAVISRLKYKGVVFKTNFTERERMPDPSEVTAMSRIWLESYNAQPGDVVVLLGQWVHQHFPTHLLKAKCVKISHPASAFHHRTRDGKENYIARAAEIIQNVINS